jgi:hypothetical protein
MSAAGTPVDIYNLTYYHKAPPPYCEDRAQLRINGVCTDISATAAQLAPPSQGSGACPIFHKAVGADENAMCLPTNQTLTSAMPGQLSLGAHNVQLGPLFPAPLFASR